MLGNFGLLKRVNIIKMPLISAITAFTILNPINLNAQEAPKPPATPIKTVTSKLLNLQTPTKIIIPIFNKTNQKHISDLIFDKKINSEKELRNTEEFKIFVENKKIEIKKVGDSFIIYFLGEPEKTPEEKNLVSTTTPTETRFPSLEDISFKKGYELKIGENNSFLGTISLGCGTTDYKLLLQTVKLNKLKNIEGSITKINLTDKEGILFIEDIFKGELKDSKINSVKLPDSCSNLESLVKLNDGVSFTTIGSLINSDLYNIDLKLEKSSIIEKTTVEDGDNLGKIAKRYNLSISDFLKTFKLVKSNENTNLNKGLIFKGDIFERTINSVEIDGIMKLKYKTGYDYLKHIGKEKLNSSLESVIEGTKIASKKINEIAKNIDPLILPGTLLLTLLLGLGYKNKEYVKEKMSFIDPVNFGYKLLKLTDSISNSIPKRKSKNLEDELKEEKPKEERDEFDLEVTLSNTLYRKLGFNKLKKVGNSLTEKLGSYVPKFELKSKPKSESFYSNWKKNREDRAVQKSNNNKIEQFKSVIDEKYSNREFSSEDLIRFMIENDSKLTAPIDVYNSLYELSKDEKTNKITTTISDLEEKIENRTFDIGIDVVNEDSKKQSKKRKKSLLKKGINKSKTITSNSLSGLKNVYNGGIKVSKSAIEITDKLTTPIINLVGGSLEKIILYANQITTEDAVSEICGVPIPKGKSEEFLKRKIANNLVEEYSDLTKNKKFNSKRLLSIIMKKENFEDIEELYDFLNSDSLENSNKYVLKVIDDLDRLYETHNPILVTIAYFNGEKIPNEIVKKAKKKTASLNKLTKTTIGYFPEIEIYGKKVNGERFTALTMVQEGLETIEEVNYFLSEMPLINRKEYTKDLAENYSHFVTKHNWRKGTELFLRNVGVKAENGNYNPLIDEVRQNKSQIYRDSRKIKIPDTNLNEEIYLNIRTLENRLFS